MNENNKTLIITIAVIAIIVLGCFVGVKSYSNLDSPLTVVTSCSMEHGDESQIGSIDTGDMVILRNKDSGITTYVDGQKSGYGKFGESGDVIVYNREGKNPVIHRAILWIDCNGGNWSAPSLKNYDQNLWSTNNGGHNWENFDKLSLYLPNWEKDGGNGELKEYTIDMSRLNAHSGYLTKGDSNRDFDQNPDYSISPNGLVEKKTIKAVAGIEVPWLGVIKLTLGGNTKDIQSNSRACLIFMFLDIVAFLTVVPLIIESVWNDYKKKKIP